MYGRTFEEARFSPLTQIDPVNVATLGLAWEFNDFVVRGRTHRGNEASPLVSDGVMYFAGPWSVVYSLDARSGKLLWKYDPQVDGNWIRRACCDAVNRGVAVWKGRVYVATLDGYLIALDAKTGTLAWKKDTFVDRVTMNYASTGAPRIAGNHIVIGNSGAEMGARGYVSAYDLESGKLAWRFLTVPGDPAKGPDESPDVTRARKTWSKDSRWDLGGGGTAWDSMVYDPALDLLYVGVGNGMPHPVWSRSPGGGDNLYLSSIVALDAASGRMRWYYQTTPADSYDYTATQNMILGDLDIGGARRHVLMQAPKNGFFYILDRATGELLSANPYTKVTWAERVDLKTGRPVLTAQADYSKEPKEIWPSQAGGHNWMPMSYSAVAKRVFIPALDAGMNFAMVPGTDVHFRVGANNEGDKVGWTRPAGDKGIPWAPPNPGPNDPPFRSVLKAWDPVAGKLVWQSAPKPYWGGGVLSTASGVVFQGATDGTFSAYDANDGRVLHTINTGTGMMAGPISYELDGVQYVAVLAGFGGAMNQIGYPPGAAALQYRNTERVLVFKLNGGAVPLPPARKPELQPLPAATSTDHAVIAHGMSLIGRCAGCHGFRGIPNGYPDLWNLSPGAHAAFQTIVLEGALSYAGMPSFKDALSAEDVKALQAFIISDEINLRK
ncbi:MAG: Pyrrolo-quinoline quinone [Gammaproteobacteria bacterium]|nr:Pyrrolo-quinoline quinone [Gammaproteobacteria bacterium]